MHIPNPHRIKQLAYDILFPPLCTYCGIDLTTTMPLCADCMQMIQRQTTLRCPLCNARNAEQKRCAHSPQRMRKHPYLLGAASYYNDPIIRTCLHRYKYEGLHALAPFFAQLLGEYIATLRPTPAILSTTPTVVPIPLHSSKERTRGFNQSALIARLVAQSLNFLYAEPLIKIAATSPQAQTPTHEQRFEHIRGAFALSHHAAITGKNILLIDDVTTSGATLSEAAQTLKAAGARTILALVVAKA